MYAPPPRDSEYLPVARPSRQRILVSYLAAAMVPATLWAVSRPLAGAVVIAALAALGLGLRRAAALTRCLADCGGFSVDLAGTVRVTVSRPGVREACERSRVEGTSEAA